MALHHHDPQERARIQARNILPRPTGPGRRTGFGQAPGQSPFRRPEVRRKGKPTALPEQASPRAQPPGLDAGLSPYLDLTRQFLRPPTRPVTPSVPRFGAALPDLARRSLLQRILGGIS